MSLISIITPCYNEEKNIQECYEQVKNLFENQLQEYDYEHIFCDNASTDKTLDILRQIAKKDQQIKIIVNSRNVGPVISPFNALKWAKGDAVLYILPVDLQDPPEMLIEFIKYWREGYKVVYGIRGKRQENWVLRNIRKIFYRIVNRLSSAYIPTDVGEFQLLDRKIVNILLKIKDYYPYTRGLIAQCGFPSKGIPYIWRIRQHGKTSTNLFSLIDVGINGIISMSTIPIRLITLSGFVLAFLSLFYSILSLVMNLIMNQQLVSPGIPTLIVAIFFFSSVQIFLMGIIGEYLSAIHSQVRQGPGVIEREIINFDKIIDNDE